MISVIFYGRNDNHGYNYYKRVAISLNCIGAQLTHLSDELIFVDYLTRNDLPTLPEAISDTITEQVKDRLRVIRVRPHHHDNHINSKKKSVLEAVARNVAIRRARKENKWILSTTTDMIFVPIDQTRTLTEIISTLKGSFYLLPRFELPEYMWEACFNRSKPNETIRELHRYGSQLHLHTTVSQNEYILYENPGDFQLMLQDDILKIGGFNETMVDRWHIDSNLCKRIFLLRNNVDTLSSELRAYHCNHTRLSSSDTKRNSWKKYVVNVDTPYANLNQDWGMLKEKLEEVCLKKNRSDWYFKKLLTVQNKFSCSTNEYVFQLNSRNFNNIYYSSKHIFLYLIDHFSSLAPGSSIAYVGYNKNLLAMLTQFFSNCSNNIVVLIPEGLLDGELKGLDVIKVNSFDFSNAPSMFIFDFGIEDTKEKLSSLVNQNFKMLSSIAKFFISIIKRSRKKADLSQTVFIGINSTYTQFHYLFSYYIDVKVSSITTRLSYGLLKQPSCVRNLKLKNIKLLCTFILVRYFYPISYKIILSLSESKLSSLFFK